MKQLIVLAVISLCSVAGAEPIALDEVFTETVGVTRAVQATGIVSPSGDLTGLRVMRTGNFRAFWDTDVDGSKSTVLHGVIGKVHTTRQSTGDLNQAHGVWGQAWHEGQGKLAWGTGVTSLVGAGPKGEPDEGGAFEIAINYSAQAHSNRVVGEMGRRYGLKVSDVGGTGPVGMQYGVYIDGLTRAGENYAIYLEPVEGMGIHWGDKASIVFCEHGGLTIEGLCSTCQGDYPTTVQAYPLIALTLIVIGLLVTLAYRCRVRRV